MITVNVNNHAHQIAASTTLSALLQQLNISTSGIAVAINQRVVPKQQWATQSLQDQQNILIIKATQGG
ncbi:sulfur carrier protein [Pustulibacterium marinum]|uniref:Sulfur carrier protein n=1 Tax=Pustulibacterium marinum TaxID=1224947 RepID=A0A1I7GB03_9FLAO|nr:sulfur carrier protein ThiS [Pustulibacterium marinum]SFU45632.1 sulfur carrier protein [Pustulibacterium marinum]